MYCGERRGYLKVRGFDQTYLYGFLPVGNGKDLGEVAECADCGTMHNTAAIEEADRLEEHHTRSAIMRDALAFRGVIIDRYLHHRVCDMISELTPSCDDEFLAAIRGIGRPSGTWIRG
jgi:hypothetical protein